MAIAVSKLDEVHALLVRIADERSLSLPRLDADLVERAAASTVHDVCKQTQVLA